MPIGCFAKSVDAIVVDSYRSKPDWSVVRIVLHLAMADKVIQLDSDSEEERNAGETSSPGQVQAYKKPKLEAQTPDGQAEVQTALPQLAAAVKTEAGQGPSIATNLWDPTHLYQLARQAEEIQREGSYRVRYEALDAEHRRLTEEFAKFKQEQEQLEKTRLEAAVQLEEKVVEIQHLKAQQEYAKLEADNLRHREGEYKTHISELQAKLYDTNKLGSKTFRESALKDGEIRRLKEVIDSNRILIEEMKNRLESCRIQDENDPTSSGISQVGKKKDLLEADCVEQEKISVDDLLAMRDYLPPTKSIEHAYVWDRQQLFLIAGVTYRDELNHNQFQQLWKLAVYHQMEDLVAEILARGDLHLLEPAQAYMLVGDIGVRVLLYHRELEMSQAARRRSEQVYSEGTRNLDCAELSRTMAIELTDNWNALPVESWKYEVGVLDRVYQSENWITEMIRQNQERATYTKCSDVHVSQYFYTYRENQDRLKRLVAAKDFNRLLPWNLMLDTVLKNGARFGNSPTALIGIAEDLDVWQPTMATTDTDDVFLAKWDRLFVHPADSPDLLSWEALYWTGKDYQNSKDITISMEIQMQQEGHLRQLEPPYLVTSDPNFCHCPRRYSWIANAKLDTVWYNWPIVEGDMFTSEQCVESYTRFWYTHKNHKDPVCYRAAILCMILAHWCKKFTMVIDIKLGARNMQDMQIYAKLLYTCARRLRALELMCLMQFLPGAHRVMLDDRNGLRKTALGNFLDCSKSGSIDRMRVGWNQLVRDWQQRNRQAALQGDTAPTYRLPLDWKAGAQLIRVPPKALATELAATSSASKKTNTMKKPIAKQ